MADNLFDRASKKHQTLLNLLKIRETFLDEERRDEPPEHIKSLWDELGVPDEIRRTIQSEEKKPK